MASIQIGSEVIRAALDPQWPRVLRWERLDTGGTLDGCPADQPFAIEINGQEQKDVRCRVVSQSARAVLYELSFTDVPLQIELRFEVTGQELTITMPRVRESGGFQLQSLYFPQHRLFSGTARAGDRYYMSVSSGRYNWSRHWVPGTNAGGYEDTGAIADAVPGLSPMPGQGCVWNEKICLTMTTSMFTESQVVYMEAAGQLAGGRAGRLSVWAGRYPYRLRGTLADPFHIRIAVLGDYNGNGKVDWCDAAAWDGDQSTVRMDDHYHETILYKLLCAHLTRPEPPIPFAQCLEIIKRVHAISGGLPQVVYLVGWQGIGHDSCYPELGPVNEKLGGREGLVRLIEEARKYNATVSLHINLDDAYKQNPGFREDVLARHPDGRPIIWFPNYEVGGWDVYSVNHTLAVESGYDQERLEKLLKLLPIRKSIHCDAHRNVNEAWLADGSHIGGECEIQRGMRPIREMFLKHGIDITTEHVGGGAKTLGSWGYSVGWGSLWGTVAGHGRVGAFNRGGMEGEGLGRHYVVCEAGPFTWEELARNFYTHWMYAQLLHRKKMLEYRIGTWNEGVEAWYEDDTYVRSGRMGAAPQELLARYEGIEIARGPDRFLPWREDTIYAYSPAGGSQKWTLPAAWEGKKVTGVLLTEQREVPMQAVHVKGRSISLGMPSAMPVRLRI